MRLSPFFLFLSSFCISVLIPGHSSLCSARPLDRGTVIFLFCFYEGHLQLRSYCSRARDTSPDAFSTAVIGHVFAAFTCMWKFSDSLWKLTRRDWNFICSSWRLHLNATGSVWVDNVSVKWCGISLYTKVETYGCGLFESVLKSLFLFSFLSMQARWSSRSAALTASGNPGVYLLISSSLV